MSELITPAQRRRLDPLAKVWDPDSRVGDMLLGMRGLVVGIANQDSIAYGCAVKLRAFGAELAVTYLMRRRNVMSVRWRNGSTHG